MALRPDLAANVRRLHIDNTFLHTPTEKAAEIQAVLQDVANARGFLLFDFIDPFGYESADAHLDFRSEVVAMLLTCLPNLGSFSLRSRAGRKGIPASALRAAGVSSLPIQTIVARFVPAREIAKSLGTVFDMALPTLQALSLHQCISNGASRALPPSSPSPATPLHYRLPV